MSDNDFIKDTEESRQLFKKLNPDHRGRGVVRPSLHQPLPLVVSSVNDVDIVIQKVPGGSPTTKIHNGGGGEQPNPEIHVVFWGDAWANTPQPNPSLVDVANDIAIIIASPYLYATRQYLSKSPKASFKDAWIDKRSVPSYDFSMADINYEAWLFMAAGGPIDANSNSVVCVVMPPGAKPNSTLFGGNVKGEHDWVILPNLLKVPTMFIKFNSRSQMSVAFSHELVETVTDPNGDRIQVDPTGILSWNEIGDACKNTASGILNGVSVQSYWSAEDGSCVIPQPVAVEKWQITCIKKRGGHSNPHENIEAVAGIHLPSGKKFWMKQEEVIARIDKGDQFIVIGIDGIQAQVHVRVNFPPWNPKGSRYIGTVADTSKEDNLLSLRDCEQSDFVNEF